MSERDAPGMDDNEADEIRELLALAAVGALDRDEDARLRERIADRPDLLAELAEHEEAAASLADAVAETPPPALRASVLAAIHDIPQAGGSAEASDAPAPAPPAEQPSPSDHAAPVVPISRARRRRWMPAAGAVLGAAAALILAVVAVGSLTGDDDGGIQVADVVADGDAVTIGFGGQEPGFRLVHSPNHNAVALVGDAIPELAADQVYELWIVRDDTPEPMEIFTPDDDGAVEVLIPDMAPPPGASFAITIEPPGGSDRPTSTAIATTA
jgi:anti-sigma-K factor RskA